MDTPTTTDLDPDFARALGRELRALREKRREKEEDVGNRLLLSPNQVRALEEGNSEFFYGARYYMQAARKYAASSGLDFEALLTAAATRADAVAQAQSESGAGADSDANPDDASREMPFLAGESRPTRPAAPARTGSVRRLAIGATAAVALATLAAVGARLLPGPKTDAPGTVTSSVEVPAVTAPALGAAGASAPAADSAAASGGGNDAASATPGAPADAPPVAGSTPMTSANASAASPAAVATRAPAALAPAPGALSAAPAGPAAPASGSAPAAPVAASTTAASPASMQSAQGVVAKPSIATATPKAHATRNTKAAHGATNAKHAGAEAAATAPAVRKPKAPSSQLRIAFSGPTKVEIVRRDGTRQTRTYQAKQSVTLNRKDLQAVVIANASKATVTSDGKRIELARYRQAGSTEARLSGAKLRSLGE